MDDKHMGNPNGANGSQPLTRDDLLGIDSVVLSDFPRRGQSRTIFFTPMSSAFERKLARVARSMRRNDAGRVLVGDANGDEREATDEEVNDLIDRQVEVMIEVVSAHVVRGPDDPTPLYTQDEARRLPIARIRALGDALRSKDSELGEESEGGEDTTQATPNSSDGSTVSPSASTSETEM